MRPLSLVPIKTLAPCGAAATEKAVTVCELQSTSAPPSGEMWKTALRAPFSSLRLRAGVCVCALRVVTACVPSSVVTVPVTVPPDVAVLTVVVVEEEEGRGPGAGAPGAGGGAVAAWRGAGG